MSKIAVIGMLRLLHDKYWRFKWEEFKRLIKAAKYIIAAEVMQVKEKPKHSTLFGRGKLEEIKRRIEEVNAEYFVVYNVLNSMQKITLETKLGVRVLDRYDITLEIFANNAKDRVSKLQIELARIEREIPYARVMVNARFMGERVFFGAGGEYKWKVILSNLRKRKKLLKEEILKRRAEKIKQIEKRKREGFKLVTIVGYYNAGKTSLFNALTGEEKSVSDMPFTTLSNKYSRLLPSHKILIADTIGFVIDLDPRIISSFEINIDDMRYADMLLLVVDASDELPWLRIKLKTALDILQKEKIINGSNEKKIIVVVNKIDLIRSSVQLESVKRVINDEITQRFGVSYPIVPVSAAEREGIDILVKKIIDELEQI